MDELAVGSVKSAGWVAVVSKARRAGEGHEDISCLAGEPPGSPPRDLRPRGKSGRGLCPRLSWGYPQLCGGSSLLGASENETQVWPRSGNPNFLRLHLHGVSEEPQRGGPCCQLEGQCPGTHWQGPISRKLWVLLA